MATARSSLSILKDNLGLKLWQEVQQVILLQEMKMFTIKKWIFITKMLKFLSNKYQSILRESY